MPLYKEWNINPHALAAIWKIDEPESFFTEHTELSPDIKNEKRRMEHLAGRFLLKHLKHDFPLLHIHPDEHDKPRIANDQYYFSISHSWPYVAVAIDPHEEAGIDIQTWHSRIQQIQHKFLSEEEQLFFENEPKLITLAWCAKEAAYKWQGRRGIEFIEQLPIVAFSKSAAEYDISIYTNLNNPPQMISIEGIIDIDFACAYVWKKEDWAIY
jgi:phosphopantetheinyl transferase